MDMIDSMTMPQVFIVAIVVLVVLGTALFLAVRVAGQRQVQRDSHPGKPAPRRRRGSGDDEARGRH